nr:hypothetical protein [Bacteroidota bacterium]
MKLLKKDKQSKISFKHHFVVPWVVTDYDDTTNNKINIENHFIVPWELTDYDDTTNNKI